MPVTPVDYKPDVHELGAIMRARTRNDLGKELGTFTEDTRPTSDEVESVIDQALALVSPRLGGAVADRLDDLARSIVTLRAAMMIEASYIPESDDNGGSAYDRYESQYTESLEAYDVAAGHDAGQERRRVGTLKVGTYLSSQ
jgi:hypothetical protein